MATYREALIEKLLQFTNVANICGTRIYDRQGPQNIDSQSIYPNLMYTLTDDSPELESTGRCDVAKAVFQFLFTGITSEQCVLIADDFATLNDEVVIDAISTISDEVLWIEATDNKESNNFAIEQQLKGYLTAAFTVTVTHI